ncbi:hypothetical protein HBI55_208740 [Parastagonospora nodorum]|nr:hypothetical protein HBH54_021500 [Parastagonospora nodorum]KAH6484839.1 hypothetical protein HBI55_208740 [Parastagonospora nodorum]
MSTYCRVGPSRICPLGGKDEFNDTGQSYVAKVCRKSESNCKVSSSLRKRVLLYSLRTWRSHLRTPFRGQDRSQNKRAQREGSWHGTGVVIHNFSEQHAPHPRY